MPLLQRALLLYVLQLQQEGAPKYAAIKIAQIARPRERGRDTERKSTKGEEKEAYGCERAAWGLAGSYSSGHIKKFT